MKATQRLPQLHHVAAPTNVVVLPGTHLIDQAHVTKARTLVYWSFGFFVLGLIAPCITMTPHMETWFGDIAPIWKWFSKSAEPKSVSILGGVFSLFIEGDLILASLIAGFSIAFPAYKLYTMHGICSQCVKAGSIDHKKIIDSVHLFTKLGKWSMLDVFVLSLIVVSFKTFPGGTTISLEFGTYAFGTSVLLSMFATNALKKGVRIQ
jgi:paraquat-inducible protein A